MRNNKLEQKNDTKIEEKRLSNDVSDVIKEVNSIFEQPWWMEAVAPGQWDVVVIKSGNQIVARWPYYKGKRLGFGIIENPLCTQTMGPWIDSSSPKYVNYLSKKKKLLEELIDKLPSGNVDITLDSSNEYILPFRWKGFRFEPTFSYRFNDLSNLDKIYSNINSSTRNHIKNAEKILTIREDMPIDVLIEMQALTFKRQKRESPIPEDFIRRLDEACIKHNARKLLAAVDEKGNVHGARYFVFDDKICYSIMSGINPDFLQSGASSFLRWEGIKFAASVSKMFDFEGSNIEGIEQNVRSFGSEFVVNYRVYKLNFLLELADMLKPHIKKIIGYKN